MDTEQSWTEDYEDEDEDFGLEYLEYSPAPPKPTFAEHVADAARYGITLAHQASWPDHISMVRPCPECGQRIEVRCPPATWEFAAQISRLVSAHHPDTCARIRRERETHIEWGIDYGVGEVQKQETEEHAVEFAAFARDGGGSYAVMYREVGPWQVRRSGPDHPGDGT